MSRQLTQIGLACPIPPLTICVLLYGDNQAYAARCLDSISCLPTTIEIRIAMNVASSYTREHVNKFLVTETSTGRNVLLYNSTTNRGKYPQMRWMFHDPQNPIRSPHIMWFDDDSFIRTSNQEWLDRIIAVMGKADMCGAIMRAALSGNQHLWIQMQPWYNGLPISLNVRNISTGYLHPSGYHVPQFVAGGWWTIRTDIIKKLDWPPTNIHHRGGDFMLGEALRQHGYRLFNFTEGVGINCPIDNNTRDHKAQRRGLDPTPVGVLYEPPLTVVLHSVCKNIDPKLLDQPGV